MSKFRYYNSYPDPNDPFQVQLDKYYNYFPHWLVRYNHRQRIDRITSLINVDRYNKILDIGCRAGAYTILVARKSTSVVGLDLSKNAVRSVKEWAQEEGLGERIYFVVGDAENLPFKENYFDIIICSEVLEHLKVIWKGINELLRVLKKDSIAIISMPNLMSYHHFRRKVKHMARKFLGKRPRRDPHLEFPFWRIINILRSVKLNIVKVTSTHLFPLEPMLLGTLIRINPRLVSRINDVETYIADHTLFKYLGAFLIAVCRKSRLG